MPTCICLALEKVAKFLQHKDQSASLGQALGLEWKPGRDTAGFISSARLLCGGGLLPLPAPPVPSLSHWGAAPGDSAGAACAGSWRFFFPLP